MKHDAAVCMNGHMGFRLCIVNWDIFWTQWERQYGLRFVKRRFKTKAHLCKCNLMATLFNQGTKLSGDETA